MKLEVEKLKEVELKLAQPTDYSNPIKNDPIQKETKTEGQIKQEVASKKNKTFYSQLKSNKDNGPLDLSMYDSMKINRKFIYIGYFKSAVVACILVVLAAYLLIPHKHFYFLEFFRSKHKISIISTPSERFTEIQQKINDSKNEKKDLNLLSENYFKEIRCHEFSSVMTKQIKYNFVSKNEMYHFYNCLVQSANLLIDPSEYTVKKKNLIEKRLNKKTIGFSSLNFAMAEATPKLNTSRYAREMLNKACIKWLKSDGCILRLVYEFSKGNLELVRNKITQLKNKPSDLSSQAKEYWAYLGFMVDIYDPKKNTEDVFSSVNLRNIKASYIRLRVLEQFAMKFYRENNKQKVRELLKTAQIHFDGYMLQRSGRLMTLHFLTEEGQENNVMRLFADNSVLKFFVHDQSLMKLVANVAIRQNKTESFLSFIDEHHNIVGSVFTAQNDFKKKIWETRVLASTKSSNKKALYQSITSLQKLSLSKGNIEFNYLLGYYNLLIAQNKEKLSKNLTLISKLFRKQNKLQQWRAEFVDAIRFISLKQYKKARPLISSIKKQGYRAEYWADQAELLLSVFYKDVDKLKAKYKLITSKYGANPLSQYMKKKYLTSENERVNAISSPVQIIKSWLLQLSSDKHQVPLTGMGLIL